MKTLSVVADVAAGNRCRWNAHAVDGTKVVAPRRSCQCSREAAVARTETADDEGDHESMAGTSMAVPVVPS